MEIVTILLFHLAMFEKPLIARLLSPVEAQEGLSARGIINCFMFLTVIFLFFSPFFFMGEATYLDYLPWVSLETLALAFHLFAFGRGFYLLGYWQGLGQLPPGGPASESDTVAEDAADEEKTGDASSPGQADGEKAKSGKK